MSYITSIGTANPPHKASQTTIAGFMTKAMNLDERDSRRLHSLFRSSGIVSRYSVIRDYGESVEKSLFTSKSLDFSLPSTKTRMELYRKHALSLSLSAIENCISKSSASESKQFTHLIVVSCTGMYAPGLDIDIIRALSLPSGIIRVCVNFMGCYAAFNAIKMADSFCKSHPCARVLVVCTELCSIHFQTENTEDNMLANALFADGSAALVIESTPAVGPNLKPISFYCDIVTEGSGDMAWGIGNFGFEMHLSSYVPEVIRNGIRKLTSGLLSPFSKQVSDVAYFAIHPGGRKILESIETELGLDKVQNRFAYSVLQEYGNMSSPTVLFVLRALIDEITFNDDQKEILSFAFGPGLTLESMLLKIENH